MRLLFMGTGDIALPSFRWLLESNHQVVGLVTQPDRPVGRHQTLTSPKIKELAVQAGVLVEQPESLRSAEAFACLQSLDADLFVVMAYGQILTQRVIDLPAKGCINLHASLLPKYRGASCIQGAIADGEDETGISVMHMEKALDAGPVIVHKSIAIGAQETGGELHDRLAELAPQALSEALELIEAGHGAGEAQDDEEASYAPKLGRTDGLIEWKNSAESIERLVRAYHPWPGTSTTISGSRGRSQGLKIFPPVECLEPLAAEASLEPGEWSAERPGAIRCGEGMLMLGEVQPEGSRRMKVDDFLHGRGGELPKCL